VKIRKPRLNSFARPYWSPRRPNVTTRTAVTSRKPINIHSRYEMFSGASGFRPRPSKIAGSEISRMDEFSVAARMPTVVTDKATRRSWASEWCTDVLSFVSHAN
jgi:hypothetical protein